MKIKESAVETRGELQRGIYKVINPFVYFLIKMKVTPNMVTTIGFLGNAAAAAVVAWAGYRTLGSADSGRSPHHRILALRHA